MSCLRSLRPIVVVLALALAVAVPSRASQITRSGLLGGGGNSRDQVVRLAFDATGALYVAGLQGADCFPTTEDAFARAGQGSYVMKIDASGAVAWSTIFPDAALNDMAVASDGSVVIVGATELLTMPVHAAVQPVLGDDEGGVGDAFVARLDPTGSTLVFSTFLGGTGRDIAYCVAFDPAGRILVAGSTMPWFPQDECSFPLVNPLQATCNPSWDGTDAFVTCLSADGSCILWSTYLGGTLHDDVRGIAIAPGGAVLLAGGTGSPDFPIVGPRSRTGSQSGFVARLAADGSALEWSQAFGHVDGCDVTTGLVADPSGGGWLVGHSRSGNDAGTGPLRSDEQASITRFDAAGQQVWTRVLGGSANEIPMDVAAGPGGTVAVGGVTLSPDLPVTNAFQATFGGGTFDGFVMHLDADGEVTMLSYLGGGVTSGLARERDAVQSVAFGPLGALVAGGWTDGGDFPIEDPISYALGCVTAAPAWPLTGFVTSISLGAQLVEPSAIDVRPWVRPLTVTMSPPSSVVVAWEETLGEKYGVYVGTIGSLFTGRAYDHQPHVPCSFPDPVATIPLPQGDVYFLVTAQEGGLESSYGRDSYGRERPPAAVPCP
jgi:hypothetical protein